MSFQSNRREFLKTGLAASALAGLGLSTGETKPNLIYILLDDAGYGDLSCYGQKKFSTPNIDRIAAEGIRFTDHYSGSPVCAPSRCTLMTGLHTGHAAIRGNRGGGTVEGEWPLPEGTITLPRLLQRAGYKTGAFGKWGLGGPGSSGDPGNQGFDEFFGYNGQMQAHDYYPGHLWHNRERIKLDRRTYSHDLIMDRAHDFVRDNRGRPFFAYLPVTIPHASLHAPEESVKPFRAKFPQYELVPGFYAGRPIRNPAACFAGMMTRLDQGIGKLLDILDELGLADNTLIMLSSDNGPHLEGGHMPEFFDSNGPLRGFKRDLYEGGIRVPMMARWPGKIAAGQTTTLPSAFWDVMPTLCEIAGADTPAGIDGISFAPTLMDLEQQQHDHLYWEFQELGGAQAVRSGKWKAVRNNVTLNPAAPLELYDLETGIGETRDLAADFPEVVSHLQAIMGSARTENRDFPLFKSRKS